MQLRVRDLAPLAGGLTLPEVGNLAAASRVDMAVDAVEAHVQLRADVPLRGRQLPVEELRERLVPRDALAAVRLPELLELTLVDVRLRVRLSGELRRRRVPPLLEEEGLDRPFRHRVPRSISYGKSVRFS